MRKTHFNHHTIIVLRIIFTLSFCALAYTICMQDASFSLGYSIVFIIIVLAINAMFWPLDKQVIFKTIDLYPDDIQRRMMAAQKTCLTLIYVHGIKGGNFNQRNHAFFEPKTATMREYGQKVGVRTPDFYERALKESIKIHNLSWRQGKSLRKAIEQVGSHPLPIPSAHEMMQAIVKESMLWRS